MQPNDRTLYKITEQMQRKVKEAETKVKSICSRTKHEKGPQIKLVEFFDENIKKYEF